MQCSKCSYPTKQERHHTYLQSALRDLQAAHMVNNTEKTLNGSNFGQKKRPKVELPEIFKRAKYLHYSMKTSKVLSLLREANSC